jgi:hypothetical protein
VSNRALKFSAGGNVLPQNFHLSAISFFTVTGRSVTFGGMAEEKKAMALARVLCIGIVSEIVKGMIHFRVGIVVTIVTPLVLGGLSSH